MGRRGGGRVAAGAGIAAGDGWWGGRLPRSLPRVSSPTWLRASGIGTANLGGGGVGSSEELSGRRVGGVSGRGGQRVEDGRVIIIKGMFGSPLILFTWKWLRIAFSCAQELLVHYLKKKELLVNLLH